MKIYFRLFKLKKICENIIYLQQDVLSKDRNILALLESHKLQYTIRSVIFNSQFKQF